MTNEVHELSLLAMQNWQPGPRLPAPQAEFASGMINGHVVIAGGRTPMQLDANLRYKHHIDTPATFVLAPGPSQWVQKAPMRIARNSAAAAVLDGKLHVIGGRRVIDRSGNLQNLAAHEVYDLARDTWELLADLPACVAGAAAAVWPGCIYLFGGEKLDPPPKKVFPAVWKYDPASGWTEVDAMRGRHGLGAVACSDGIHLLGGATHAIITRSSAHETVISALSIVTLHVEGDRHKQV